MSKNGEKVEFGIKFAIWAPKKHTNGKNQLERQISNFLSKMQTVVFLFLPGATGSHLYVPLLVAGGQTDRPSYIWLAIWRENRELTKRLLASILS
jgi:hypothetical protein